MTTDQKAYSSCFAISILFFYSLLQCFSFNGLTDHLTILYSPVKLGILSSLFLVGIIMFLFPAGFCLEKYPLRKIFLWCLTISLISQITLCFTDDFYCIAVNRLLNGIANAFVFLGALRVIKLWFPNNITLVTGVVFALANLSGIFCSTILTLIYQHYQWAGSMLIISIIGIITLFVMWNCFYEPTNYQSNTYSKYTITQKIHIILSAPINWLYACFIGIYYLPCYVLGALWSNYFFSHKYSLTIIDAGYLTSISIISGIIGYILFGLFDKRSSFRHQMMILTSTIIFLSFYTFGSNAYISYSNLCVLCFLYGLALGGGQTLSFSAVNIQLPIQLNSLGNAIITLSLNVFGIVGSIIFGYLLEPSNNDKSKHVSITYSIDSLNSAINMLTFAFFIAIFISLVIYLLQYKLVKKTTYPI